MSDYDVGFKNAEELINTTLVNGIDEFPNVATFVNFIIKTLGIKSGADIKDYIEGVADATTQHWVSSKEDELKDLELEKTEFEADFQKRLAMKRAS